MSHEKAPAYQWYPKDYDTDEEVKLMTYEQEGMYRRLLDHQWLHGSIPDQPQQIARLLGKRISPKKFEKIHWPSMSMKFQKTSVAEVGHEGRLLNQRLERQRGEMTDYWADKRAGGIASAEARRLKYGTAQPNRTPNSAPNSVRTASEPSSSSATASAKKEEKNVSAEPPKRVSTHASTPVVLEFSVVGPAGPTWALHQGQVDEWRALYQGLDVLAEARKALAWTRAHNGRRKTAGGMVKFLQGWLSRAVDRGGARNRGSEQQAPVGDVPPSSCRHTPRCHTEREHGDLFLRETRAS